MTQWQPLSVRCGLREQDGPFDGIPEHLTKSVLDWFTDTFDQRDEQSALMVEEICLKLQIRHSSKNFSSRLKMLIHTDQQRFLDAVDYGLYLHEYADSDRLRRYLRSGASIWTVAQGGKALELFVPAAESDAYAMATTPQDDASEHLAEAWTHIYGRHPDPSDAWDHAIKAVEALLWELVIPNSTGATLGTILDALAAKPSKWSFRLASSSKAVDSVKILEAVIRLVWPNPDRHGSGIVRMPTLEEAENVVQTAVMIVGWLRTGALVKCP